MKVRLFQTRKRERSGLISGFLRDHQVSHELVRFDPAGRRPWHRFGDLPALEVDGRLFVNPNGTALRKIFKVR